MESNIKASFIPDKLPTENGRGRPTRNSSGSAVDILMLLAIVALAVALALAAGVFLYSSFLTSNVQSKSEQLARAQQAFEPALVAELVRLDARLDAANTVLAQHLAPSEIFNLLEELTLQSVSYSSMDYALSEDGTITLKLQGKARSVNGVALQASVFGQHNAITNPIFGDLDLVSDGVEFTVTATVNPAALRYSTVFRQYSQGVQTPGVPTQETLPTSTQQTNEITTEDAADSEEDFGEFGGALPGDTEIAQ